MIVKQCKYLSSTCGSPHLWGLRIPTAACQQEVPGKDPGAAARAAEAAWDAIQAGAWPFQALCDGLCADLVSPRWEARHGAAMALREVLRSHASSAAVQAPLSAQPSGDSHPNTSKASQYSLQASLLNLVTTQSPSAPAPCMYAPQPIWWARQPD